MGNGMNKVLPGLYVGNFRDSRDETQLKDNKITHILSIHDNAKPARSDMIYLCLGARDVGTQDVSQYFSQSNDFIHSARIYGGNVLIHCLAGMSRSVTLTVAYIMTVTPLGWRDALSVVRVARPCTSPNFGFQKQLLAFQHERACEERSRLQASFPPSLRGSRSLDDATECQRALDEAASRDILARHKEKTGKLQLSGHRVGVDGNTPWGDTEAESERQVNKHRGVTATDHGGGTHNVHGGETHNKHGVETRDSEVECARTLMEEVWTAPKGSEEKASLVISVKKV